MKHAAKSQGDVAHPNTKIATIAAAVASGVNTNEVGLAGDTGQVTRPITSKLRASWARRVAMLAERFGTTSE